MMWSGALAGARFSPDAAAPPLLDRTANTIACAFGLSRLRTAYAGMAVRVRRSSDNAETDVGFGGSGALDAAALLGFCGAADGFVSKWFDQGGAGADAMQTVAASQPRIVSAGALEVFGAGRPALRLSGAQFFTTGIAPIGDLSVLAGASRASAIADGVDTLTGTGSGSRGFTLNMGNSYGPASDAAKARFYGNYGSCPAVAWLNGIRQSNANPFDTATAAGEGAGFGATVAGASVEADTAFLRIGADKDGSTMAGAIGAVVVISGILPDALMASLTDQLHGQVSP